MKINVVKSEVYIYIQNSDGLCASQKPNVVRKLKV